MTEPENTVRNELRDQLAEFAQEITLLRENGDTQEQIEQRTADFEMDWRAILVTAQERETDGRQIQVREQILAQDQEARGRASVKDNALMRGMMAKDAPVAYWQSAPSRTGLEHEYDIAKQTNAEFQRVAADTQRKYKAMGDALTLSLQNIENEKEPDFIALLAKQIEREQLLAERQGFDASVRQNQQAPMRKPGA